MIVGVTGCCVSFDYHCEVIVRHEYRHVFGWSRLVLVLVVMIAPSTSVLFQRRDIGDPPNAKPKYTSATTLLKIAWVYDNSPLLKAIVMNTLRTLIVVIRSCHVALALTLIHDEDNLRCDLCA